MKALLMIQIGRVLPYNLPPFKHTGAEGLFFASLLNLLEICEVSKVVLIVNCFANYSSLSEVG